MILHVVYGVASGYEGGDGWVVAAFAHREKAQALSDRCASLHEAISKALPSEATVLRCLRGEASAGGDEVSQMILELTELDPHWKTEDPTSGGENAIYYSVSNPMELRV